MVYDYDYCCDNEPGYFDYDGPHRYDDDPDYFVYDDHDRGVLLEHYDGPGGVGPLRFSDFAVPDNCGLCRGLHGPSDCGECCVSPGEADVVPFWPDVEEWGGYVDEVALLRTESDEQRCCMFNSVVCTSPPGPGWPGGPGGLGGPGDEDSDIWEKAVPLHQTGSDQIVTNVGPGGPCDEDSLPQTGSDEPFPGVMPCWTGLEKGDTYSDDDVLPRTGSHEPVPGVTPCWTGLEECDVDGGDDVLPRTGSNEPVPGGTPCWASVMECDIYTSNVALSRTGSDRNVTPAVGPGGPGPGIGAVTDASGDGLVMSSECRGVDKGTLDVIHYEPPLRCYM